MAGEKRVQEREEVALEQSVILVDIEGTTTSISFVKDTLFPYVRENLKKYIDDKWDDEEFKADLKKLKEQAKQDEDDKVSDVVAITDASSDEEKESLMKNVLWQMDNDRKTGALKQLQGHIWREAYKIGAVKGHIYDDVKEALESWSSNGKKVYVYSSGSVEAQKLLFGHSEKGDLLKYFNGHFDTEVGPKQEAASYKNIINKIGVEPSAVLFLTDIAKEAEAAKEAGMSSIIVSREGNAPVSDQDQVKYTVIKSFQDLVFQSPSKRQKVEDPPADAEKKLQNGNSVEATAEPMETEETPVAEEAKVEAPAATESKEVVEAEKKEEKKEETKEEAKVEEKKPEEKLVEDKQPEKKATSEAENMEINVEDTDEKAEETKAVEPEKVVEEKKTEEKPEQKAEPEVEKKEESKPAEVVEEVKKVEEPEKVEVTKEKEAKEETKEEVKEEVKAEEAITNGDTKTEDKPEAEPEKKDEEEKKVDTAEKEEAKTETSETKEEKKSEETTKEAKEVDEGAEKKVNGSAEEVEVKKDEKTNGEEEKKDKPHTNGVETKEEQEKKSEEAVHNGETPAEEAIKVKKVVDAVDTAAEAEPVVTPVAVAATS